MTLELNLQEGLVGHWTMDREDIDSGVLRDSSPYNYHGTINNPTSNYFGPNAAGYWEGDVEQLGAVDGFKDVGKVDATINASFEDVLTNQFTTGDFPDSGSGYYVYLALAMKGNNFPNGGFGYTFLKNPTPDPNKYQLYILKSDGQNSRDEYFRLYYSSNDDTSVARIADPFVWTQDDEGPNARIIGDSSGRTVEPFTQGKYGDAYYLYNDQIFNIGGKEPGSDSFSISFWIKGSFKNNSDNYPRVMRDFWGRGADGSEAGDSGFRFDSDSTGRYIQAFRYPGVFNDWTHVACSVDQSVGEGYFYENGERFFTDTFTAGENISSTIPGFFGANVNWTIEISDFYYYKRALSDEEISALYNIRSQRNASV